MDFDNKNLLPKILIVEDDADIIQYYTAVFEDAYDVATVKTADKAIECIQSAIYSLTIVDYRLPDMSGIDLLKKMKSIQPSLPVIMITAFGDEDIAVKAFRQGASDYLKKPISYSELTNKVKMHLKQNTACESGNCLDAVSEECEEYKNSTLDIGNHNFYKIQKSLQYIDSNFTNKINLDEAAYVACISKYHFSKLFKKMIGSTYQAYINNKRIGKAKELLRQNTFTITQVAHEVGYADITHFERIFKRITGYIPSYYRATFRSQPPAAKSS